MNTALSFIIVLGVLIFVHELGHFLFAKYFNVKVLRFSLGFGPKIFGKTVGETEYVVSALPLGGYVKMVGQGEDEFSVAEEDKDRAFVNKPVWQRFLIVLAGPLFNLILPIPLFLVVYFSMGIPVFVDTTIIGSVGPESPAAAGGLQPGDEIISINGEETLAWQDVSDNVRNSKGEEMIIVVNRNGLNETLRVLPKIESVKDEFGQEIEQRYLLGIMMKQHYEKATLTEALRLSVLNTYRFIEYTVQVVKKLLQRDVPASELGGPIMIAKVAGDQMRSGILDFISFMGVLSINLGILNLLPIPVLDGGHLVFLTYESIARKPMSEKVQLISQQLGMAMLLTLMVFVFYNDIVRFF